MAEQSQVSSSEKYVPTEEVWPKKPYEVSGGVSLRDYFAAMALNGMLSDSDCELSYKRMVTRAYEIADAMLKARVS
jgi:hypothetical protein